MAATTSKKVRSLNIYQVFTRNYGDGTFKAIERDIPRIKALGMDYIYLLPVQPSGEVHRKGSMGSPYAIKDYRAIDPVQGTMEDFIELTEKIHEAGMKVMIDVVYNHTSPDSWLAENHSEWFYHKADGSLGNRIGDWWDVVDLDYSNADLWDYQIETLKMWAEHVDGFRCDVAPMIPLDFWLRARREVEEVRPGCLWLAEAVEPEFIRMNRSAGVATSTDGELYQAFDICYDYDVYGYQKGAQQGVNTLAEYLQHVELQESVYPENYAKLRCLENHDRPRAAALVPDEKALKNWTAWNAFEKGTVMIYAGQEFEVKHHPTLFDLDTVDTNTGKDLSGLIAKLSEIRKNPVFEDTSFFAKAEGPDGDIIVAEHRVNAGHRLNGAKAVGIFSVRGRETSVLVDLPDGKYVNAIDGAEMDVFEKTMYISGEPVIIFA